MHVDRSPFTHSPIATSTGRRSGNARWIYGVGVRVTVLAAVGTRVGDGVDVGAWLGVGDGVGDRVGDGVGVGVFCPIGV